MNGSQIVMLIAMAVYLLGIVFVGFVLSSQNETMGDFYLGGRKLGPFVSAMSAEASDMSSWLLMGLPGVAYLTGVADAGWTAIGLAAGTYLNWLIVAKKLRRYTEKTDSITVPTYFSNRYNDKKGILTFLGAMMIIIFFVPYTASGFAACGKLFGSLFGIDYHLAMVVSAIVIILYTSLGGFLAASITDFVQSIVMSTALIIILVFGISQAGGIAAVLDNARALPGYLSFGATYSAQTGSAVAYAPLTVVSTLAWGLGYFGMPHILLRFMAIRDDSKIKVSRRIASVWVVISMTAAVLIGIIGLAMTEAGAVGALEGSQSETIIVEIAQKLALIGVPAALVAGVVLSGILASTMSTADSQLLAASSSVSNDILVHVFHLEVDQKKMLRISRVSLLVIAILGMFFAWDSNSSVFGIVSFAWAGFGAAFGPVVLLSLFWRRSNRQGAIAGMISGAVMIFVWKFCIRPLGGIVNIYELLPAFLIAIAVNIIVSLLTPAPEKSVTDIYDQVHSMK